MHPVLPRRDLLLQGSHHGWVAQRRDIDQRNLVIDYRLSGQPAPAARRGLSVGVAGALILIANVWWRTRTRRREDL